MTQHLPDGMKTAIDKLFENVKSEEIIVTFDMVLEAARLEKLTNKLSIDNIRQLSRHITNALKRERGTV